MGEGRDQMCGSLELFNSSKKMTRQGRYVQRGLVPSSIANSSSPPMSQLHTHYVPLQFLIFSIKLLLRTAGEGDGESLRPSAVPL